MVGVADVEPPETTGVGLTPAMLSVTLTLAIGSSPGLVTLYVQVTVLPTGTVGPSGTPATGGLSLLVPFVNFTMSICGCVICTGSSAAPLVTGLSLPSPLKLATQ